MGVKTPLFNPIPPLEVGVLLCDLGPGVLGNVPLSFFSLVLALDCARRWGLGWDAAGGGAFSSTGTFFSSICFLFFVGLCRNSSSTLSLGTFFFSTPVSSIDRVSKSTTLWLSLPLALGCAGSWRSERRDAAGGAFSSPRTYFFSSIFLLFVGLWRISSSCCLLRWRSGCRSRSAGSWRSGCPSKVEGPLTPFPGPLLAMGVETPLFNPIFSLKAGVALCDMCPGVLGIVPLSFFSLALAPISVPGSWGVPLSWRMGRWRSKRRDPAGGAFSSPPARFFSSIFLLFVGLWRISSSFFLRASLSLNPTSVPGSWGVPLSWRMGRWGSEGRRGPAGGAFSSSPPFFSSICFLLFVGLCRNSSSALSLWTFFFSTLASSVNGVSKSTASWLPLVLALGCVGRWRTGRGAPGGAFSSPRTYFFSSIFLLFVGLWRISSSFCLLSFWRLFFSSPVSSLGGGASVSITSSLPLACNRMSSFVLKYSFPKGTLLMPKDDGRTLLVPGYDGRSICVLCASSACALSSRVLAWSCK